jgi:hypothetical protein
MINWQTGQILFPQWLVAWKYIIPYNITKEGVTIIALSNKFTSKTRRS